jgi:protein ATS1
MAVLLASGSNSHGQLANGGLNDSYVFTPCSFYGCPPGRIPANSRILNLASGANHVLVLLEPQYTPNQRELWGCGDGSRGQLGPSYPGDSKASTTILRRIHLPLENYVVEGYTVSMIAASWETSYVVLSCRGKPDLLLSMGGNDYGDLGIGDLKDGRKSQGVHIVKFDHLTIDGRPLDTNSSQFQLQFLATGPHNVVLRVVVTSTDSDSQVFTVGWGSSRHGQLGALSPSSSTCQWSSPFISTPQIVFTDLDKEPLISIAIGLQHAVCVHSSHRVSGVGSDRKSQIRHLGSLKGYVKSVSCTWNGTYVDIECEDGERRVFATGSSSKGQLGRVSTSESDGLSLMPVQFPFTSTTHRLARLACGSEHVLCMFHVAPHPTCNDTLFAPESHAEVWGWGWNEHGNLGTGTTDDIHLPTKIWPSSPEQSETQAREGGINVWGGCGTSWIAIGA